MVRKEYMAISYDQIISNPSSGIQGTDGRIYMWRPNGSGGIDYFRFDDTGNATMMTPITNTEFGAGTGTNTSNLEGFVSENNITNSQYSTPAQAPLTSGIGQAYSQGLPLTSAGQTQATNQPVETPTTETVPPFQAVLGDRTYTDPQAYADAQRALVEEYYNQNISSLGRDYSELERQLGESEGDVTRQYGEGTSALGQALEKGRFRTAQQFDVMAPSLYQSGEGITLQDKKQTYDEQLSEYNREKERALAEIMRGRSDIQYNRPLEEAQYAKSKQEQFDAIANQLLQNRDYMQGSGTGYQTKDENALKSSLGAYKAPSMAGYNVGYGVDATPAVASLSAVGNQPVGNNFAEQGKTTNKKKPLPSPLDYLYGY
jgi:hypothetical protein